MTTILRSAAFAVLAFISSVSVACAGGGHYVSNGPYVFGGSSINVASGEQVYCPTQYCSYTVAPNYDHNHAAVPNSYVITSAQPLTSYAHGNYVAWSHSKSAATLTADRSYGYYTHDRGLGLSNPRTYYGVWSWTTYSTGGHP